MTRISSLCLAALLLAAAASPPAAQVRPDSLRTLPPYSRNVRGDFRPPQTSATRAYLYSAAATGGAVAVGTVILVLAPDPDTDAGSAALGIGGGLVLMGILAGPAAGNLSLGAGRDVYAGSVIKARGLALGSGIAGAGVGVGLFCVLGSFDGGGCAAAPVAIGLVLGGAGVAAGFAVAGIVHDLATIPANARWAREARARGNRVPVVVAPTVGLRRGTPTLGLRARF